MDRSRVETSGEMPDSEIRRRDGDMSEEQRQGQYFVLGTSIGNPDGMRGIIRRLSFVPPYSRKQSTSDRVFSILMTPLESGAGLGLRLNYHHLSLLPIPLVGPSSDTPTTIDIYQPMMRETTPRKFRRARFKDGGFPRHH